MVKIFCKLCQQSVEVNAWSVHITTGKHTSNLPSNIIVKSTFENDKVNDIHEYFAQFGKILKKEVISSAKNNLRIQYSFENASAYSTIVQKQHMLFGQRLEIESFKLPIKSATPFCEKKESGASKKELCSSDISMMDTVNLGMLVRDSIDKIPSLASFTQQVTIMQENIKLKNSYNEQVLNVIGQGLTLLLKSKFPFCKVYFFGSKVTGLDIGTNKLGVYIDKVRQSDLNENQVLDSIESLILKSVHFVSIGRYKKEECPIIKCKHDTTNTICYINVRDRLIVKRSELIKYYVSVDEKVQQFLLTIKFWISSQVAFKGTLQNDALYLLAIFYLQQEPYKLPPLVELQKNISPHLENEWNCAFTPILCSRPALQKAKILDLVNGFFKFYESFDFFSYVVSPFCGYPIEKTRFLQPYQLPECYSLYVTKKRTLDLSYGIAVQDPFEHSKNRFQGTPISLGTRFASFCRHALLLISTGESRLLSKLLKPISSEEHKFSLEKPMGYAGKKWKNDVTRITRDILTHILCWNITKTIPEPNQITYDFISCNDVWTNRVVSLKELESDLFFCNEFKKEVAASSRIVKDCHQRKTVWNGTVRLLFHPNKVQVFFMKCPKNKACDLNHFFRVKMEKFLNEGQKSRDENCSVDLVGFNMLANTIKTTTTLLQQTVLLQEKWQQNKIQVEKECKTIIDDLNCALSSKFKNQIYILDLNKTPLNFPNKIVSLYLDKTKETSEWTTLVNLKFLLEKSQTFSKVSVCFEAGILKFTHKKSQNRCGLSIRNQNIMTRSAELIRYYLSLDPKLQPLLLIIELWANYYKLSEVGLMTTYTLHLMVIFYLQQEYKVPSVANLQKSATAVMIDFWNCAILATKVSSIDLKKATLLELVRGFFAFYSNFDYISDMISPFYGFPIEKTKLLKPYNLPECFREYVRNDDVISLNLGYCVQDFFEHSRNLVAPQPFQTFAKFSCFCRRTLYLIEEKGDNFFADLFSNEVRNLKPSWEYEVKKPEKIKAEEWKDQIKNLSLKIMRDILTYECSQSSADDKYECVGKYDVLVNRLNVLKNVFHAGGSKFDKEVAVTAGIVKEYSRKLQSVVQMRISSREKPCRIIISFSSTSENFNLNFTDFFFTKLMKFLPKYRKIVEVKCDKIDDKDIIEVENSSSDSNQQMCLVPEPDQNPNYNENKTKTRKNEQKDDDLSDIFDDFLHDDFLDGLPIVDSCNLNEKQSRRQQKRSRKESEHTEMRRKRFRSSSRERIEKEEKPMKKKKISRDGRSPFSRKTGTHSPDRSVDLKKRQVFLDEIRNKINEIGTPSMPSLPAQSPRPAPVPPPNSGTLSCGKPVQSYDQNFYIGSQTCDAQNKKTSRKPEVTSGYRDEHVLKLYEEKKLSLSDYLTIRAKHTVKSVTLDRLLKRTKVISQCLKVIQIMDRAKFGLLSSQPSCDTKSETKYKSPLLRTIAKFKFTNPYKSKSEIEADTFSAALYKIFQQIGVFKQENDVWKLMNLVADAVVAGTKIDKEMAAQIFQISLLSCLAVNEAKKVEVGTQCKENRSVAVQANENDAR